jgi:hypothetical protein
MQVLRPGRVAICDYLQKAVGDNLAAAKTKSGWQLPPPAS